MESRRSLQSGQMSSQRGFNDYGNNFGVSIQNKFAENCVALAGAKDQVIMRGAHLGARQDEVEAVSRSMHG